MRTSTKSSRKHSKAMTTSRDFISGRSLLDLIVAHIDRSLLRQRPCLRVLPHIHHDCGVCVRNAMLLVAIPIPRRLGLELKTFNLEHH
jgi:hypothetical protein